MELIDQIYTGLLVNMFEIKCLVSKHKSIKDTIKRREHLLHALLTKRNKGNAVLRCKRSKSLFYCYIFIYLLKYI